MADTSTDPRDARPAPVESMRLRLDSVDGPLPMSFPGILRNPRVKSLSTGLSMPKPRIARRETRDADGLGSKRRMRRLHNATLASNPHRAAPSARDMQPGPHPSTVTFPAPPPPAFPPSLLAASIDPPQSDAASAEAGRFRMSLKAVRKALKHPSPRTETVIRLTESELDAWLGVGGSSVGAANRVIDATLVYEDYRTNQEDVGPAIIELARSAASLCWIVNDPYTRFVIHSVARYYGIVSFSKTDLTGRRLTYLMRPFIAVRRPAPGFSELDTPPTTELEHGGSDLAASTSDLGTLSTGSSDVDSDDYVVPPTPHSPLSAPLTRVWSLSSESDDAHADVEDVDALAESMASVLGPAADTPRPRDRERRSRLSRRSPSSSGSSRAQSPARRARPLRTSSGRTGGLWQPPPQTFLDWLG